MSYLERIEKYYNSRETKLGNRIFFGGRAHLGYYPKNVWWPFPINRALIAMEDHLFHSLGQKPGARVLDAGCGDGYVAIHLAKKGLRVDAIDVLASKVLEARRNVEEAKKSTKPKSDSKSALDAIKVKFGDYHNLDTWGQSTFDSVCTIETLVHASDLGRVFGEFHRVLKPGGRLALYEYDHWRDNDNDQSQDKEGKNSEAMKKVRQYGAIPRDAASSKDAAEESQHQGLARMLVKAGFEDVQEIDLSENVRPLLRLFFICFYIPYLIVIALGLEARYINIVALVTNYRHGWTYVAVTGRKPQ